MVLALVVRKHRGGVALVAKAEFVDELYAALPVAVEDVVGRGGVHLVLAADEVPHEVAPVHPVHLVVEEIAEVGAHRGLEGRGSRHVLSLAAGVVFIEGFVLAVVARLPHPREEHLSGRQIPGVDGRLDFLVLSVERGPVGRSLELVGRPVVLAVHQRRAAVLLAGEVSHEGEGVVGLVFVGRGLGAGAYHVDAEHGEAYHYRREAEQGRVEEGLLFLERHEYAPEAQAEEQQHEEHRSGVERQAEHVDEQEVGVGGELGQQGDDSVEHEGEYDHSDQEYLHEFPEPVGAVLPEPVVVDEHYGRDHQQVEQVDSYAEAHDQRDQHYPLVGIGPVGPVVPHGHGPEHHRRHERGHRIDLTLHRGEPEGVGEAVCERAHEGGAADCQCRAG